MKKLKDRSKKQDVIDGIRSMTEQAIEELNDIPDSLFDAIKDYECEGASRCGHVKLKLRAEFPEMPNTKAEGRLTRKEDHE